MLDMSIDSSSLKHKAYLPSSHKNISDQSSQNVNLHSSTFLLQIRVCTSSTIYVLSSMLLILLLLSQVCVAKPTQRSIQRSQEMELDARVVKGQRAEGAVYLFQRVQRPLPPLLSFKRNELKAIVLPIFNQKTVLGQKVLQPQVKSATAIKSQKNKQLNIGNSNKTKQSKKRRKSRKKSKWSRRKSRKTRSKK
jgi:hypothetical protein